MFDNEQTHSSLVRKRRFCQNRIVKIVVVFVVVFGAGPPPTMSINEDNRWWVIDPLWIAQDIQCMLVGFVCVDL